jgi:hypothetical protein
VPVAHLLVVALQHGCALLVELDALGHHPGGEGHCHQIE